MKILLSKLDRLKGLWFHILGIACIIWFLVRVFPAPHRARYPCQQMSMSVAMGYIAFWSVLFHGLGLWIKRVKLKTTAIAPTLLAVLIILFTVTGPVFANNNFYLSSATERWDPVPNEPIGTPQGVNPGRVVWVWDPNATDWDGSSNYWWESEYNDQEVIEEMFSSGIQTLAGEDNDSSAWDSLFQYFNQAHGHGDVGYRSGEKIVIKVNLNNCWHNPYDEEDNDADANPYLVKALLDQLVNTVGVAQENITVYDAVRTMANWFYNPLASDFPDVNYTDYLGGASGRQKVTSSGIKIYFTNGMDRTLPLCVTQAKYLINMPIMKRHSLAGVTLSGKNHFGSFMTSPAGLHDYVESSFTEGNPAPQTDIHAHEHIGGKTLLYIGDGLFGSPKNHWNFGRFEMYPFNDDWANSLFFSQDGVAIDSVMWDFLNVEGDPAEGSQNYLHQSAEPPADVYDPEGDGTYLNDSLGVHEHWNTTKNIFSSNRYSGPAEDGIDYIAVDGEGFEADANGPYNGVVNISIQFYGNASGGVSPYTWYWDFGDSNTSTEQNPAYTYSTNGNYTATLTVTDDNGTTANDTASVHVEPELEADANGPYSGTICEPIEFSGSASGGVPPYTWYWDFGDGDTSTKQNISHQYDETGNYTVTLTVTDDWGYTDDDVTWALVTYTELKADANGPYEGYYIGADVKFNGTATGGCEPYSWLWDFGDGNISDEEDPTHQYTEAGNYTVTLTVTDDLGYTDDDVTWANITDRIPDLECEGSLSWTGVTPGDTVTGDFDIGNVGDPGSLLNWRVDSYPNWGTWTLNPPSGSGLKPGDDPVTVQVTVIAPPDKNTEFTGKVKVVNSESPSDSCEIPVSLTTPKNKPLDFYFNLLNWLFERFPNAFPILRFLL